MLDKFCYSCAAPVGMPDFRGPTEKYCTDESGNLKSRDEVQMGLAEWLKSWQPDLEQEGLRKSRRYVILSRPKDSSK